MELKLKEEQLAEMKKKAGQDNDTNKQGPQHESEYDSEYYDEEDEESSVPGDL